MKKSEKSTWFSRVPLVFSGLGLVSFLVGIGLFGTAPYNVKQILHVNGLSSSAHYGGSPLFVAVSRSYVQPGESYYLYAVEPVGTAITSYTGPLDYQLTLCTGPKFDMCTSSTGRWLNMSNGLTVANLSTDIVRGVYKARFRPSSSSVGWSNEIQVNVGTTVGLENMRDYWLMPQTEATFVGKNNRTGESFTAKVGYKDIQLPCLPAGAGVKAMYIIKDRTNGYWAPGSPSNLLWYLTPWHNAGFHDTYLNAEGHEAYELGGQSNLEFTQNFKNVQHSYRYGSTNPNFPGYVLAPQWVGAGWGVGNAAQTYSDSAGPDTHLCAPRGSTGVGTWAVHADIVNLALPKYNGPAIMMSYWELFGVDAYVERWFFVKGVGLVKIQANTYGTASGEYCDRDPDCYVNRIMQKPQVEMTLAQYATSATVQQPSRQKAR